MISKPCELRAYKTGLVCVCNSTNCDTLEVELPKNDGEVLILSTSKTGLRYHETRTNFRDAKITIPNGPYHVGTSSVNDLQILMTVLNVELPSDDPIDSVVNVSLNRTAKYQKIIGFGGAFTGAVSYNMKQLSSPELRKHVYQSYYSKKIGNGYNLMRIPIGGCDFDLEPWAYNESPPHDFELTSFKQLDPRDIEKINQISELKNVADNYDIKVFGAAWSPPKWMKTNGDWTGFSALREEYYQTWVSESYNLRNFLIYLCQSG